MQHQSSNRQSQFADMLLPFVDQHSISVHGNNNNGILKHSQVSYRHHALHTVINDMPCMYVFGLQLCRIPVHLYGSNT